ncbi:hypothetical protein [Prevotella fusca]|uniref:Uncharacterized protein n=1 Tax=Prevotella fusca JCM 17724 TaxID=1236517 RepID=A0A0K1NKA6_9BACT|nr:hypothetical protein [Prevotella fusca]AKU69504.1 hypothetical protein ADJ77_06905 [Prevotella fusca JCM 17724]QUB87146.1 hypothetical protein J5A51_06605 [Prevotella fusca JCM 17724]
MEKKRSIKTKNILRFAIWILILSFVVICVCYLSWAALFRPVPGNQPELSVKEKEYFNEMEGKEGWDYVRRSVYNINKSGESLHQRLVDLDKDYAYMFRTKINDSITFFSLPNKTEDTIALHLYNHIIHKSPRLKKIIIIFNYDEDLNERASIGHSRTEEYAVRGKRLVKLKHDTE